MFILIAVILVVGLVLYYITTIDFEVGDGFTEIKKKARDVDYEVVNKKEDKKMLK